MFKQRHQQPSLWHKGLAKDIEDLWEPWMREVDQLLEAAALVEEVYQAQGKRHPKSQARGRIGRSRTAAIDPETCAELELRHAGTRSARQLGVSRVHADRRRSLTRKILHQAEGVLEEIQKVPVVAG